MADALTPCPFCASLDLSIYGGHSRGRYWGGLYWAVLCQECWAMGPEGSSTDEATERWNRGRHDEALPTT